MYLLQPQLHSRRAFLRRSAQLAFTGAALPTALNLASMGEAAAFNAPAGSYKALVCVFLYGGNDYGNSVITYDDPSYNLYSTIRGGAGGQAAGGIALAKSALTPTLLSPTNALPDSRQYALHPSMTGLAGLFNAGKAAVQLNVGPLAVPMDKSQYQSNNRKLYPLPPKLFSHNDQQSLWQSSSPEGSTIGWGGNIGDLAVQNNTNTNSLFTCMSVTGNAVFLSGDSALSYQVSSGGAVKIRSVTDNTVYGSSAVKTAMSQLVQEARNNVLENEYSAITKRAIGAETAITSGIGSLGAGAEFAPLNAVDRTMVGGTDRGKNSLASQMKMVARLIAARSSLGTSRQVFFVSLGGFDLHDNLISGHEVNMARVSQAMTAFYETTQLLGVANDVTAFTASDFGRTMTSNGDGSDHGWGSHHMMVGGAVRGKAFYGYAPPAGTASASVANTVNHAWEVGRGRLLPTTSVDQYAGTLASWFGVTPAELVGTSAQSYRDAVLPGLHNFNGQTASGIVYPQNLGFMV